MRLEPRPGAPDTIRSVAKHRSDFKVKNFPCLDHFLTMAFAQLTWSESLRDYAFDATTICNLSTLPCFPNTMKYSHTALGRTVSAGQDTRNIIHKNA
ncbi:DUF4372 domain-containing protein [Marinobacter iranensis]|uniref:DUF4372 domain-containing protein n=1 Tax=Marinobacter iranensis TaxID=2962607 RepID=UPI003B846409